MATIVDELVSILGYKIEGQDNLKKYRNQIDGVAKDVTKVTNKIALYANASHSNMLAASSHMISYGNKITDVGNKLIGLSSISAALFLGGAFGLNKFSKEASNLEESINAVNVVFGEGANKVLEFSKKSAEMVGLSSSEFNQMSTETGALLSRTGETKEKVAELTNQLAVRAADLASVYNTDVKLAMSAINQALRGETEAIRKYAADVTDASVQSYLLSKGINKKVASLTQEEKTLYRLRLLMEQTNVVNGDFSKTIDQQANSQRVLNAQWKDAQAKLGKNLLPIKAKIAKALANILDKFNKLNPKVQSLISSLLIFGVALSGLLALLAPVFVLTGKLVSMFGGLLGAITLLNKAARGQRLISFLSFFRKNKGVIKALKALRFGFALLAAPILKVAAAVALLYLGIDDLYHFLTGGKSVIGALLEQLKTGDLFAYGEELGKKLVHGIFEGARRIGLLGDKIEKLLSDPNFYKAGFEIIGSIVSGLALAVMAMGSAFANVAAGIFWGIVNALVGFDAKEKITLMVTDLIEDIVEAWNSLINFYDMGVEMVSQLFEGMKSIGGKIKDWFADLVPEWAEDFIGGDNEAEINNSFENLAGNLNRSDGAAKLSTNNLNNSNTNNSAQVNNQINIEQNVSQAVKAPDQLAKATQRAMGGAMPKRSQLQQEPIAP